VVSDMGGRVEVDDGLRRVRQTERYIKKARPANGCCDGRRTVWTRLRKAAFWHPEALQGQYPVQLRPLTALLYGRQRPPSGGDWQAL